MTPEKMLALFERQYLAGKTPVELETTCAAYAVWLASAWEMLNADERVLLTSIGAALWRDGYDLTAGSETNDPW
ncbi:hypothetical protein [Paraburkholderia sp.]|uniref:hypothetical protein n=1 Tax=Paraburkholderia sp. TaxID=1926495 RepID=UPI0023A507F0|nr:hypothetical protein [Paraburkholderia sp.]MDE1182852.1 hypothetical protein [Paraburkholderia sp.]